jgi:nucleoside-diphosphate-sugar epimerase
VNVTVFGATGVVGRALLPLLAGHELTAVSRSARDLPGARCLAADVASGEGVAAALEGAQVAYYLVHSLGARDFEEQDPGRLIMADVQGFSSLWTVSV